MGVLKFLIFIHWLLDSKYGCPPSGFYSLLPNAFYRLDEIFPA